MLATNVLQRLQLGQVSANMSALSCQLYGVAIMTVPTLALEAAETLMGLSIAAFLNSFDFNTLSIRNCMPRSSTLKEIMIDKAVDTVLLEQK